MLAERRLNDNARAGIGELLEPGESLSDCSTWADEHLHGLPHTAAWHYVDVRWTRAAMTIDSPETTPTWGSSSRRSGS